MIRKWFVESSPASLFLLTGVFLEQDLQSSISYAGGNKLEVIRYVDYVIVKNSIVNGDKVC
jgi:GMP reductase